MAIPHCSANVKQKTNRFTFPADYVDLIISIQTIFWKSLF